MAAVIVGLKMIEALISVFSLLAFRVVVIWGVGCSLEASRAIIGLSQPELCIRIGSNIPQVTPTCDLCLRYSNGSHLLPKKKITVRVTVSEFSET